MGAGIAQAFAAKGFEVILRDIKDEFVDRILIPMINEAFGIMAEGIASP